MPTAITNRWGVFALTSVFFLLSQFYRASTAVISTDLIQDLSLNASDLSLMSSAFFYVFALVQIPLGLTLDRFGPRLTMSVLSLFGISGALLFAWAETLQVAVGARILLGLGMACNLMGPFKLLTLWFSPGQFASLSTVMLSIGAAGSIIASSPLVALVQWLGWRWAFTLIATFHALLTVLFFLLVRDCPPDHQNDDQSPGLPELVRGLRILVRSRDYWIISMGYSPLSKPYGLDRI
jgi:MFS family permease